MEEILGPVLQTQMKKDCYFMFVKWKKDYLFMVGICFEHFLFDCSNDKMMNCTNLWFFNEISVLEKHFFRVSRMQIGQWNQGLFYWIMAVFANFPCPNFCCSKIQKGWAFIQDPKEPVMSGGSLLTAEISSSAFLDSAYSAKHVNTSAHTGALHTQLSN